MVPNSVYSGNFVTQAKKYFSNSQNTRLQVWSSYVKGNVQRQEILRTALEWIVKSSNDDAVDKYLNLHRADENIDELQNYFDSVTDWANETFAGS